MDLGQKAVPCVVSAHLVLHRAMPYPNCDNSDRPGPSLLTVALMLQRVNGRLAMLAFVAVAFGELTTHKSVLEQVPTVPFRIVFVSLLISAASIIPKYSSGTSLLELTEVASRTGLPPQLKFFNKTHEVWVGRVAMLGFTGLIIVELFKGGALFG